MTGRRRVWEPRLAVVLSAAALAFWWVFALRWQHTGWDFPVFYIAGSLPAGALYSREAFSQFWQEHLASLGVLHWARFVRLPVFSFLLHPLAWLPYRQALATWVAANAACYLVALALLKKRLALPWIVIPAFLAFYPALAGGISGQDNCLMLLGVVAGWLVLDKRRDYLAGGIFALCLYKFNLLVLIPVVLLVHRRVRALSIFLGWAIVVAGASCLVTPLRIYVAALQEVPNETAGFFPFGMRGLSLVLGQPWLYPMLAIPLILLCCWLATRLQLSDAYCVSLVGALLVTPYVCWYDSTLLVFPLARMIAIGSSRIRIACVVLLSLGSGWRFLLTHLFAEMFVLVYFAHLASKPEPALIPPGCVSVSTFEESSANDA